VRIKSDPYITCGDLIFYVDQTRFAAYDDISLTLEKAGEIPTDHCLVTNIPYF